MGDSKTSLLACLKVLEKYSDETHPIKIEDIQGHLKEDFNIEIDRRTIYNNIALLEQFEYEISNYKENRVGYYLVNRQFEKSEIIVMVNAIHASNSISPGFSRDLIKRLLLTQGENYYKSKRHQYWTNTHKMKDGDFFYRIEIINEAICQNKCIEFDYMRFNLSKELVKRREQKYVIHPYKIVYSDEKSYLVGKSNNHLGAFEFSNYRIDKIRNCSLLEDMPCHPLLVSEEELLSEYSQDRPYMFSGDFIKAELRCDLSILDQVIDTFGTSIILTKDTESGFIARIKTTEKELLIFAFQYAQNSEILKPLSLREIYLEELKAVLKKY